MKKKKQAQKVQPLSPKKYIMQKGRSLPIDSCWILEDWQDVGETTVLIVRRHASGKYTIGLYLVDTFCLGLKDTFYKFNVSSQEYDDLLDQISIGGNYIQVSYNEAHNLIFGAIAFAEEAGIKPSPEFALTQYLLEEDTEDVPLIEYEFGKNGKHFLVAKNNLELNTYLPLLEKNLPEGEYDFIFPDELEEDEDEDENDEDGPIFSEEHLRNIEKALKKMKESKKLPQESYNYIYPEYPKELKVKHPELVDIFYDTQNQNGLPPKTIQDILALPHDELREDLEHIVLYEIGQTYGDIPQERFDEPYRIPITHCLFFLGELKDNRSLPVVLEVLKQKDCFYDFHFGDFMHEIITPTVYLLGKDRLEDLSAYMMTPGFDTFARAIVSHAVSYIVRVQPERREEVTDWFRRLLIFYEKNLPQCYCCDGNLVGMVTCDLLDIHAKELLPQIKVLYDTHLVDETACGNYNEVQKHMSDSCFPTDDLLIDIFERYQYIL